MVVRELAVDGIEEWRTTGGGFSDDEGRRFVVVQPGKGALDDPAGTPEAGAVLGLAPIDLRPDPALAQFAPVPVVVVAAVGGDTRGPTTGRPTLPLVGRHPFDKRNQLRDRRCGCGGFERWQQASDELVARAFSYARIREFHTRQQRVP